MMNKVLITGATGFIGSHCLKLLSRLDCEVHGISSKRIPLQDERLDTHWHKCNLQSSEQINRVIDRIKPTHLLHLAWHVAPGMQLNSPENYQWVKAGIDLLQSFARTGGRRVVIAGSCAEYDWNYGFMSEKLTPSRPENAYGTCKNAFQLLLSDFCRIHKISWSWGRIFFTYGPNENPTRLVPYVIRSLLNGRHADCTHGRQIRDYLYVKDVADALVTLLMSDIHGPVNIASGKPIQQKTIINKIIQKINIDSELVRLGARPVGKDEPSFLVGSNHRLKNELKWQPKISLNEGLEETISWWKENERQTIDENVNG